MKPIRSSFLLLGLALALPAAAQEHPHASHDAHPAQDSHETHDAHPAQDSHETLGQDAHDAHVSHGETVFPATRWSPDEPLSQGMQRVRAATLSLSHADHGHLDGAQVDAIADELQSAVEAMFAQCKLDPEPDAALHPLLARVLTAATSLREAGFDAGALAMLEQVLADYPRLFDDPAWNVPAGD
ncbi:MAG TPA: DnrO protein [Arenimonas sp.]|jgi:hypothetical protein|nr:DnrO protein [Arenimonas sp.]